MEQRLCCRAIAEPWTRENHLCVCKGLLARHQTRFAPGVDAHQQRLAAGHCSRCQRRCESVLRWNEPLRSAIPVIMPADHKPDTPTLYNAPVTAMNLKFENRWSCGDAETSFTGQATGNWPVLSNAAPSSMPWRCRSVQQHVKPCNLPQMARPAGCQHGGSVVQEAGCRPQQQQVIHMGNAWIPAPRHVFQLQTARSRTGSDSASASGHQQHWLAAVCGRRRAGQPRDQPSPWSKHNHAGHTSMH